MDIKSLQRKQRLAFVVSISAVLAHSFDRFDVRKHLSLFHNATNSVLVFAKYMVRHLSGVFVWVILRFYWKKRLKSIAYETSVRGQRDLQNVYY